VGAVLESLRDFAWIVDESKLLVACNQPLRDYFERQFGARLVPGIASADVLPRERAERMDACYDQALAQGPFVEPWKLADGRTLEIAFNPVIVDGETIGVTAFTRDVTARVRAEDALHSSEAKFRAVVENSYDGILFGDAAANIRYRSPSYKRINGFDDDERVGHSGLETVHPDDVARVREAWKAVLAEPGRSTTLEYRIRHKDGSWRSVETAIQNLLANPAIGEMVIATRDVTERKRLETERDRLREELFQAQKMEAIGRLAGGVAHDFNNILGVVLAGLSALRMEPHTPAPVAEELSGLEQVVMRGADIAKQLLGFARKGHYQVKAVHLRPEVERTCTMFGRTRRDIVVETFVGHDLPAALVDPTQLQQLLLNLLLNAGSAMPDGGRIAVSAEAVTLAPAEADRHGTAPGAFVKLTVADTGSGIGPDVLPHVFEPFFTTRPGEGTGLGLASAHGIVRGHGGAISVASTVGEGTSFAILLPVAPAPPTPDAPAPPPSSRTHPTTVLVVEDEALLRASCTRILQRLGYETLEAATGEEALRVMRDNVARVSLVVLDMRMPGMSGAKTFDALRQLAPDLRVLIVSGFTQEAVATDLLARGGSAFIEKPFDGPTLAAKLAELLPDPSAKR
jgi:PAS domain S-box-containing protein